MKIKGVVSDLRVKTACLLFQEFSPPLHNLKLNRDAIFEVSACMKIKPESVLRYMRQSGDWFRSTLETLEIERPTLSGVTENINIVSPGIRAVATLKEVGNMTWAEISKALHTPISAVRKRWSRWTKLKKQLKMF